MKKKLLYGLLAAGAIATLAYFAVQEYKNTKQTYNPSSQDGFAGAAPRLRPHQVPPVPYITVCESGCDYVATSTGAQVGINAAIQAAASSTPSGGTVVIKAGDYGTATSSNIFIRDNVTLMGEGAATNIRFAPSSNIRSVNNGFGTTSNVTIKNFKVDATAHIVDSGIAIYAINAVNWHIENMWVETHAFGIFVSGNNGGSSDGVWVENNYIHGCSWNDLIGGGNNDPQSQVRNVFVLNNYVNQDTTCSGSGTYYTAVDLVAVRHSVYDGNITFGNILFGNEKDPHESSKIVNNDVSPVSGTSTIAGIIKVVDDLYSTTTSSSIIIANNTINGGYINVKGKSGQPITNIVITGNSIKNSTTTTDTVVHPQHGIWLEYTNNSNIQNNNLNANGVTGTVGILLADSLNNLVGSNYIDSYTTGLSQSGTSASNIFLPNFHKSNTANASTTITTGLSFAGGNLGVGSSTPSSPLTVVGSSGGNGAVLQAGSAGGGLVLGADVNSNTITNGARKVGRVTMPAWTPGSTNVLMFAGDVPSSGLANEFYIGGVPSGSQYAMTALHFVTGTATTTTGGTERLTINSSSSTFSTLLGVIGTDASIKIGEPVIDKTGCLQMYDSVSTSTLMYIYTVSGTLTASSTKPSFCQ